MSTGSGSTGAVKDDAQVDEDHAHEGGEMGRCLGRGVPVQVPDVLADLEMRVQVEQASEREGDDADLRQRRQGEGLGSEPFYREHVLVIHLAEEDVKGLRKAPLVLD